MKTGASVHDNQGNTWTLGQELWQGPCARTFVARSSSGREGLLSLSRGPSDFEGESAPELAALCATVLQERTAALRTGAPWMPALLAAGATDDGHHFTVVPRFPATLAHRIRAGAPLASLLDALVAASRALGTSPHGDLRPEHILLAEDGSVRLIAPVTATQHDNRVRLEHADKTPPPRVIPPEATGDPTSAWDGYALCLALYKAASLAPAGADGRRAEAPSLPDGGLDKVALSAVKDRVHARLQQERANPRFASRVADKLGAVLNRGLSRQAAPSPPYRFTNLTELAGRLEEVRDLVDPRVLGVGRVLLSSDARDGMFEGGEDAAFSTTVTVTPGASHEDLATGLLVRDLDAEGDDRVPVPDARYAVKPHPSGRLRFDFALPELRPGRYTVRVAFTVKDSGHEPETADGHFEIRPPPGYVPPADEPPPEATALRFPGGTATRPEAEPEDLDRPAIHHDHDHDGPFGDDAFPSPIAPSDPGSSAAADAPPPPVLHAVPTPPPSDAPPDASQAHAPGFEVPRPSLGIAPSTHTAGEATAAGPATVAGASTAVPTATEPSIPSIRPSETDAPADAGAAAPPPSDSSGGGGWGPSGATWEALPGLDEPAAPAAHAEPRPRPYPDDLDAGLLPTPEGMTDLPGFEDPASGDDLVAQVTQFLQENVWLVLAVVVGGLVLLLVLAGLVFQALAG